MNILVCVKQVPDTAQVKLDPKTNRLQRAGVDNIMNPFDTHAVEAALLLREAKGGKVTVLSMGPPQAEAVLRECISLGVDEVCLLSDRAFGGADTLATAYTLAAGIRHLGEFDLILCGKQAIDGDTAQVGPQIAEMMNIPQITGIVELDIDNDKVTAVREHEDGYETVIASLPLLVTTTKSLNVPRYPSLKGIITAGKMEITVLSAADLTVDPERLGIKGSPTQVRRVYTPNVRKQGHIITADNAKDAVTELLADLKAAGFKRGGTVQ